ncbi:unnamed protein product [Rhizophagus irregularis]|nr:unnamed protein product [Rhizophagus irregularis]
MKTKAQLDMTDRNRYISKTHERLLELESPFSEEFEQLGVVNNYDEFLFLLLTFKDFWHQLFYEAANNFLGELQKESRAHQATISSSNQVLAQLDDHSMEIEILEKPKHQSPVVPPVIQTTLNVQTQPYTPREKKHVTYAEVATSSGSSSDDSRPMSLFPKDKRNTQ